MKLFKQVIFSLICYAVYMMMVMFFTYPIVIAAYQLGFSVEQISDNMSCIMLGALAITLLVIKLVSVFVQKYKG